MSPSSCRGKGDFSPALLDRKSRKGMKLLGKLLQTADMVHPPHTFQGIRRSFTENLDPRNAKPLDFT